MVDEEDQPSPPPCQEPTIRPSSRRPSAASTDDPELIIAALQRQIEQLVTKPRFSKRVVAGLHEELGEMLYKTGRYQEAQKTFMEAMEYWKAVEEISAEGYINAWIGNCLFGMKDYTQAKECFTKSLESAKQQADTVSELKMAYNLGLCESRQDNLPEALTWFEAAIRVSTLSNDHDAKVFACYAVCASAHVKQIQNSLREAVTRFRQGLEMNTNDPYLAFFALTNLGICYQKQQLPTQALQQFMEARDMAMDYDLPIRDQVRALFHVGVTNWQLDYRSDALEAFQEAEKLDSLLAPPPSPVPTKKPSSSSKKERQQPQQQPIGNYLRSTITAFMASLTLLQDAKNTTNLKPILAQVLEYCDMANNAGGTGHALSKAMVLNTQGIILAIQGDLEASCDTIKAIQDMLDKCRLDPPPLPSSFLPEDWANEAIMFNIDVGPIRDGLARNLRMYQRNGVGLGGMLESGVDGATVGKLKANLRALTAPTTSKDYGDVAVEELQGAFATRAISDDVDSNRTDATLSHLMTALTTAKQKGDKAVIASAYRSLADLYEAEGSLDSEMRYLKEYEATTKDMLDKGWYADCCRRLMSIYTRYAATSTTNNMDDTNTAMSPDDLSMEGMEEDILHEPARTPSAPTTTSRRPVVPAIRPKPDQRRTSTLAKSGGGGGGGKKSPRKSGTPRKEENNTTTTSTSSDARGVTSNTSTPRGTARTGGSTSTTPRKVNSPQGGGGRSASLTPRGRSASPRPGHSPPASTSARAAGAAMASPRGRATSDPTTSQEVGVVAQQPIPDTEREWIEHPEEEEKQPQEEEVIIIPIDKLLEMEAQCLGKGTQYQELLQTHGKALASHYCDIYEDLMDHLGWGLTFESVNE